MTVEKAAKRQKAGGCAQDDFIWTMMSGTVRHQTLGHMSALHLRLDKAASKVLVRTVGSQLIPAGHPCQEGWCWQTSGCFLDIICSDRAVDLELLLVWVKGSTWKWLQAERSPYRWLLGRRVEILMKKCLDLATVSFELEKSKVKSKCISRTWCNKEVTMAISLITLDWRKEKGECGLQVRP